MPAHTTRTASSPPRTAALDRSSEIEEKRLATASRRAEIGRPLGLHGEHRLLTGVVLAVGETRAPRMEGREPAKRHRTTRLYLEAMEEVLPEVEMYVIDSEKGQVPLNLRVGSP